MKRSKPGKSTLLIVGWMLLIALTVLAPGGGDLCAAAGATLKIGGTGGALGAMGELAAAFQQEHPGVSVSIIPHLGTRGGISGVLTGALDIGVAARPLGPEELAQGLVPVEFARSPLVFVTRSDGGRMNLTLDLIADIYRGELRQWPDGTTIRTILRPEGDIDILMLKAMSPAIQNAVRGAEAREGMLIALDDQENCDLLEKVPGSFGTSTLTQIVAEQRALTILPLNGVTPDLEAMAAGRYPFFKPFQLFTGPKSSPLATEFIAFVTSPAGSRVLARTGNLVPEAR